MSIPLKLFSFRRGQTFAIDLTFGLLIMTLTLLSVVLFLPERDPPFSHDAERIQMLMTEGVPANWNNTTVILPGFLSNNRFNRTKIEMFDSLGDQRQKALLGISSSFTITFSANNTTLPLCGACGSEPASYSELLPIRRVAVYRGNITTMEVRLYR